MATLVTWISPDDVSTALGFVPASTQDQEWLAQVTDAANDFAYRRRQNAGYVTDQMPSAPSEDVKTGTVLYAMTLYKERGSVDSFTSFEGMPSVPVGGLGQVLRLLGVGRPQVA